MSFFEARDLERAVDGRTLFRALSFAIQEGESLAILGPSGSGKSLLLRLLAGLDPLPSGSVRLQGKPQTEWEMPGWRAEVVYCAQRPPALPGTPADLAAEVGRWSAQEGREHEGVAEIARLWQVDDVWNRPWAKLSGGEAQRAALAIAVARRPKVLLLDEPTSALDERARGRIEGHLEGRTSIWVTHDRAQADRVAERRLELTDYLPEGP